MYNSNMHLSNDLMETISGSDFDPMTKKEERQMLSDESLTIEEKRNILVMRNTRLIYKIAKKYSNIAEMDDMIQEGIVGLYKAAETFDLGRDIKFCTYAYWYIVKYIQEYLSRENKSFSSIRNHSVLSFNHKNNDDTGDTVTDRLNNEVNESTYTESSDGYNSVITNEQYKLMENLDDLVNTDILDDRERLIIKQRFLSRKPMTLMELGKEIGLSHSMVKVIGDKALGKLKKYVINKGLSKEDFLSFA